MISQPFFPHFSLFSTALCDLTNSRPVHSLMLSSHLFLCLPCLLTPFIVPCKMVLARPDERETSLSDSNRCLEPVTNAAVVSAILSVAWVTDEADRSVLLLLLSFAFLGKCDD